MSRYIDVDEFSIEPLKQSSIEFDAGILYALRKLDEQPTADAVEVVRCRDCTWWKSIFSWNGKEHKVCVRESAEPPRESDDYCSYGERKILPKD